MPPAARLAHHHRSMSAAFAAPAALVGCRALTATAAPLRALHCGAATSPFVAAPPRRARARARHAQSLRAEAGAASPNDGNDGQGDDAAPSSVDWDSDWSKFKTAGMQSDAPVGRAPPTAQEKAVRKAAAQVRNVASTLPTRQALFADWRFWVAILVSLSVFTAVVGGSQSQQPLQVGTM
jgi:hypothetical protein